MSRTRAVVDHRQLAVLERQRVAALALALVEEHAQRRAPQPGPQRAVGVEARAVAQRARQGLLGEVLGARGITDETASKRSDPVGVTGDQIDRAARDVITDAGLGDEFVHGVGHGVGLLIHEDPFLKGSEVPLQVGQVVTVEPGVYRSGFGGVRVEDTVVVTPDGCRPLTHSPKDPVVVA